MITSLAFEALTDALKQYIERPTGKPDDHQLHKIAAAKQLLAAQYAAQQNRAAYKSDRLFVPSGRSVTLTGIEPERLTSIMQAVGAAYRTLFDARAALADGAHPLHSELFDLQTNVGEFMNAWFAHEAK